MPSKLIDRINKLIALSASSNENEARNAAYLAVKLIRENGVVLSEKDAAEEDASDGLEEFFRWARAQAPAPPPRQPRQRPPRPKEPPKKNPGWGAAPSAQPSKVRAASQDELNDMFKDE